MTFIDPELAVHPYRQFMSEDDVSRVHTAIEEGDYQSVSTVEIAALADILYDTVAAKVQTHEGVTLLQ